VQTASSVSLNLRNIRYVVPIKDSCEVSFYYDLSCVGPYLQEDHRHYLRILLVVLVAFPGSLEPVEPLDSLDL
jgi:hypothetical protein